MPLRLLPLTAVLFLLVAVPTRAQSGHGGLKGIVLPENPEHANSPWNWDGLYEGLTDSTHADGSPYVKLTPIEAHLDPEPFQVRANGMYGRYDFGRIPMGLYLLRVEAPGYRSWEAEVYIASDNGSEINVLLHAVK